MALSIAELEFLRDELKAQVELVEAMLLHWEQHGDLLARPEAEDAVE